VAIDPWDTRRCGLAWAAKVVCSGAFITGRDPRDVVRQSCGYMIATDEELRAAIEGRRRLRLGERLHIDVDPERQAVTLTLDGTVRAGARRVGDQGCVIVEEPTGSVQFEPVPVKPDVPDPLRTPWPMGDAPGEDPASTGIDPGGVDAALALMFEDPRQHTNAFLVVHRGRLVGERYRAPFDRESRFESWSMGKSIAASLAGILVQEGRLDLSEPVRFDEWRAPDDPRSRITTRDLLHMSSGIQFSGSFDRTEDPTVKTRDGRFLDHIYVYAGAIDAIDFCSRKPAEFPPNRVGRYRNCDPLLVTRLARDAARSAGEEFLAWPQRKLFDRLGMSGMVLETDPYGSFLICGHDYGRARDWARLGLLYLQRGAWGAEQILPERFVEFVQTPAPAFAEPVYGGFLWLNRSREIATLPEDACWMAGAGGQRVLMVPSLDLVIVRMGHLIGELAGRAETLERACGLLVAAVRAGS
jgi:CubicO group peptidase (beta-lactamase class C family)